MANNRQFSPNNPLTTQGKYGEIQDFGGGAYVYADPRDNPNYKPPGTSPTSGNQKEDPIATSTVRRYTGNETLGESEYDRAAKSYVEGLDTSQPDESLIRANALQAIEAQKNSIQNVYAGLVSDERNRGVERLGRTRAVAARSGTLGSDFGNAELDRTDKTTGENVAAIRAEEQLKIEQLFSQVNQDVERRVKEQKELATKNQETRLAYLKEEGDRAKSRLKSLAQAGASINDLSEDQYNYLLEASGLKPEELEAEFIINKPKKDIVYEQAMGSNYIQVSRDPKTGALKTETLPLGFEVPKDYSVQNVNGQLFFMPKQVDFTKPIGEQIKVYGSPTNPTNPTDSTKAIVDGALKTTQGDVAKGVQFLNSGGVDDTSGRVYNGVGEDGWADPNLYKYLYDQWRANGGTPTGFIKYYPPKDYVNPAANPQLPSFLQNKSGGSSSNSGA